MDKNREEIRLMLDGMPMTRYQTCFCCHTVRQCHDCCNTCKSECNMKHPCEFLRKPDTTWMNSIIRAISKEYWIYPD